MNAIDKTRTFLSEVKTETRKVTWPKFDELKESTTVVIVAVFVITVFISVIDLILGRALDFVMHIG